MTQLDADQRIAGRLDALLERLDRMAAERDTLLEENRALRKDVLRMQEEMLRLVRGSAEDRRVHSPNHPDFAPSERLTPSRAHSRLRPTGEHEHGRAGYRDGELPVPVLRAQREPEPMRVSHAPQPAWGPSPTSDLWGRGLEPEQLTNVTPAPGRAIPRRDMDLGYINRVSEEELDQLPYGLVILDVDGDVLFYNETEARYAGFRRETVVGRNFFRDIAPCTRVKEFQGVFQDFVTGRMGRVHFFDFVFHFAHGSQSVLIGLAHGREHGTINVMMTRR